MIKKVWTRIKGMQLVPLLRLILLLAARPRRIRPTLDASKQTMAVCDKLYGNTHHRTNKANAFRHAFWNIKIAQNCQKMIKNAPKSAKWAQKVTDMYENVSVNEPLERAMDLHNNEVGIQVFLRDFDQKEAQIVQKLKEMAQNAVIFNSLEELNQHEQKLVYLKDDSA